MTRSAMFFAQVAPSGLNGFETLIVILLIIAVLFIGFLVYQVHKKGLAVTEVNLKAQAKSDLADAKQDASNVTHALDLRLQTVENDVRELKWPSTPAKLAATPPPTPSPAATPPSGS